MIKHLHLIIALLPLSVFAQNEFYNKGAEVYVQTGALIHVQGDIINDATATSIIKNDGIIELKGDFSNLSTATGSFAPITPLGTSQSAVRFVGPKTGTTQNVNMNASGSFFNVVVDMAAGTNTVDLQTSAKVDGSLIFGSGVTTATYNPAISLTANNQRGIITTGTNLLDITNSNFDAIKGYDAFAMNNSTTTGFVQSSGSKTNNGGLQRKVTDASYEYPIATSSHKYNPVKINFSSVSAGGSVKGKFNDVTGSFGNIPYSYVQYPLSPSAPYNADNNGFNYYFSNNPCSPGNEQWLVLENAVQNHGYWSFEGTGTNTSYVYDIEVFPTTYTDDGVSTDLTRAIKYSGVAYNVDAQSQDWGSQIISSVSNINDLLSYTKNAGCVFDGVPGGIYTGFSHFGAAKAKTSNALPVELIYLKATAIENKFIEVAWATALEINNDGFFVLRSTDGLNFSKIGWVNGNDNSTLTQTYSYNDLAVAPNVVYYYKLLQMDNDGQSEQTYTVTASLTDGDNFVISEFIPNPTQAEARLNITTSTPLNIGVKLYDILGREVLSKQQSLTVGENRVNFDAQVLAAATYTAIITTENKVYSKKLVVTR